MPSPSIAETPLNRLSVVLSQVCPDHDYTAWQSPLASAFAKFDTTTPERIAGAMGQFLVEAGPALSGTIENLHYSTAARILQIFPDEVPSLAVAQTLVDNPVALGNKVYAGRNGNTEPGDGYLFRGRGLIQITGRTAYTLLGSVLGRTPEDTAAYCETPTGAAVSSVWWLTRHGFTVPADARDWNAITRIVNGRAMVNATMRASYSEAVLRALAKIG